MFSLQLKLPFSLPFSMAFSTALSTALSTGLCRAFEESERSAEQYAERITEQSTELDLRDYRDATGTSTGISTGVSTSSQLGFLPGIPTIHALIRAVQFEEIETLVRNTTQTPASHRDVEMVSGETMTETMTIGGKNEKRDTSHRRIALRVAPPGLEPGLS